LNQSDRPRGLDGQGFAGKQLAVSNRTSCRACADAAQGPVRHRLNIEARHVEEALPQCFGIQRRPFSGRGGPTVWALADPFYFSRRFSTAKAVTPSQYRPSSSQPDALFSLQRQVEESAIPRPTKLTKNRQIY